MFFLKIILSFFFRHWQLIAPKASILGQSVATNVNVEQVTTNMVFVKVDSSIDINAMANALKTKKILISPSENMRLVTHLDISKADINSFITAVKNHLTSLA